MIEERLSLGGGDPLSIVAQEISILLEQTIAEKEEVSEQVSILMDEIEDGQARLHKLYEKENRLRSQLNMLNGVLR